MKSVAHMVQVVHIPGPPKPLSWVVQMVQSPGPSDHSEPTLNTRCANEWLHSRCSRAALALGAKVTRNKLVPINWLLLKVDLWIAFPPILWGGPVKLYISVRNVCKLHNLHPLRCGNQINFLTISYGNSRQQQATV
jgi:hypothetical protein